MIAVVTGALLTISTYIGISLAKIQGMYLGNVTAGILVTIIIVIYLMRKLDLPFYDKNIRMFDTFRQNPGIIPFSFVCSSRSVCLSFCYFTMYFTNRWYLLCPSYRFWWFENLCFIGLYWKSIRVAIVLVSCSPLWNSRSSNQFYSFRAYSLFHDTYNAEVTARFLYPWKCIFIDGI